MYNSDGLTAKVSEFVQANMPAEQVLSYSDVQAAAKVAGLTYISDVSAHPQFFDTAFKFALLTQWGPETQVRRVSTGGLFNRYETKSFPLWQGTVFRGKAVVRFRYEIKEECVAYTPYLGGWNNAQGNSPDSKLFSTLGISSITVSSPEKLVSMPIPSWVWANDGDGNGYVVDAETTTMFESEARVAAQKFAEKLKAFL